MRSDESVCTVLRGAGQGVSIMQDKHQGNIPFIGSVIIIMNNVQIGVRKEIRRHDTVEISRGERSAEISHEHRVNYGCFNPCKRFMIMW